MRPRPNTWNDLDVEQAGEENRFLLQQRQYEEALATATKELTERLGPQGAVSVVRSGGVTVGGGQGFGAYVSGIRKSNIESDGDVFFGSDVDKPEGVSFAVFANAQAYNGEEMNEGDVLFGNNSSGFANVKWDTSETQFQFRNGTTIHVYLDTDGTVKAGGGSVVLNSSGIQIVATGLLSVNNGYKFVDADGENAGGLYASVDSSDNTYIGLRAHGQNGGVLQEASVDAVASQTAHAQLTADSGLQAGAAAKLRLIQDVAGSRVDLITVSYINMLEASGQYRINDVVVLSGTKTGVTNGDSHNHSGGDGGTLDGLDIVYTPIGDLVSANVQDAIDELESEKASRVSANVFNDAGADVDQRIEGDTDPNLFVVDAGLDAVGFGGAAESGYKLKVTGAMKVTGKVIHDAPSARVYNSGAITLSNGTATALTFDSERWDTDTIHSTSSNTERLTATTAGVYVIHGHVSFNSNATGIRATSIRLNAGATIIATSLVQAVNGENTDVYVTCQYQLAAGDYIRLFCYQNSGGNLDIAASGNYSPEFSMTRIG